LSSAVEMSSMSFAGSVTVGVVTGAAGGAVCGDITSGAGGKGTPVCSACKAWAVCAGAAGGVATAFAVGFCVGVGAGSTAGADGAGDAGGVCMKIILLELNAERTFYLETRRRFL
jgi:hypothetical protein